MQDDSPLPSDDEISDDDRKDVDDDDKEKVTTAAEDKPPGETEDEPANKGENNSEAGDNTSEIKPLMSVSTEKSTVRASAASRIGDITADRVSLIVTSKEETARIVRV